MKTKNAKFPKKQIRPNDQSVRNTPRCMIAMPFGEDWSNKVFSIIKNVMRSIKIDVYKVDTTARTALKLIDDVISQIHDIDIVVADLTNQNANVHIEIGMASVLGKNVLAITQSPEDICTHMGDHLYIKYTADNAGLNELSRQLRLRLQECKERAFLENETRKLKLQVIPEYKVTCFRDRGVANLGEVFSKARKRIDILTTNLSWIFDTDKAVNAQGERYWDKIIESVKRNDSLQIRILTLNPESEIASMRGKQLGFTPANFRDQLRYSLQKASASANEYPTNRIEIRLYDELPTQITFRVDNEIFTCIVSQPMQSRRYPVLRFETANLGAQEAFLTHFLSVWNRAGSPRRGFEHMDVSAEKHLVFSSFGLDLVSIPSPRYFPVRIFINNVENALHVSEAVHQFLKAFHFSVFQEHAAEIGSWFKEFIAKTVNDMKEGEFKEELNKGKRAIELLVLQKTQSEIDKNQAEAAAGLIKTVENEKDAVLQIGSILVVKHTGQDGKSQIFVRTLTQNELIYIENHPEVIKNPASILDILSNETMNHKPLEPGIRFIRTE